MVIDSSKHTRKTPLPQGSPEIAEIAEIAAKPNKIGSSTHYDFEGKNFVFFIAPPVTVGDFANHNWFS